MRNIYRCLFLSFFIAISGELLSATVNNPTVSNLCYNTTSSDITVIITEAANGDFGGATGRSYVLKCPTGFEFVAGFTNTSGATGVSNTSVLFESPGYIGVNYDDDGAQTGSLSITFRVKATGYGSGNITKSGGTAVAAINSSTSHASLSTAFTSAPTLTPASASVCPYAGTPVTLTGTPGGGTYSGTNVTANKFNPAALAANSYTQTYTVNQGGCVGVATSSIEVKSKPNVTLLLSDNSPCTGTQISLTGGGATQYAFYMDDGVAPYAIKALNFNNTHNQTFYAYMNNYDVFAVGNEGAGTCFDTSSFLNVTVNSYTGSAASWLGPANYSEYQITDNTAKQLTATPANGVFAGPGVTSDQFVPAAANVGNNVLTYTTPADVNGCKQTVSRVLQVNNGYVRKIIPAGIFDVNWCVNGIYETIDFTAPAEDTLNARFGAGFWSFQGYAVSAARLNVNPTTFMLMSGTSYTLPDSPENPGFDMQKFDPYYISSKVGIGISYIYTLVNVGGITRYTLETSFYLQNPYVSLYYYGNQPSCVTATNQSLSVYPQDGTITNYWQNYIDTSGASPKFNPNLTGVTTTAGVFPVIAQYTDVYGCTNRDTLNITVIPQPTKPVMDPNSIVNGWATKVQPYCLYDYNKYYVCTYESGVTYNWFNNTALTSLVSSQYYLFPPDNSNTPKVVNYYVNKTQSGCTSDTMKVTYIVNDRAFANAGIADTICSDGTVTLTGSAKLIAGNTAVGGTWSGFGGSISGGATNMAGVYTPSIDEINQGFVTLTLSTADPDGAGPCPIAYSNVTHRINLKPDISAATYASEYCASEDSVLLYVSLANASVNAATWSESSIGTLSNASGYSTYYRFNPLEISTTSDLNIAATVTTNAFGVCTPDMSTVNFTIKPRAQASAGNDAKVCQQKPSSVVNLSGSRSNAATSSTWYTENGGGSFTSASSASTTYNAIPADYDKVLKFYIVTNDPVGPCAAVSDTVEIVINSLPIPFILNTDTVLCRNEASLTLVGNFGANISTRTFTGPGVNYSGQYKLNPGSGGGGSGVGNHTITYHVTDANNCTDSTKRIFKVYPIPDVDFTTSSNCEGDLVTLSDISTVPAFPVPFPGGSTVVARKWKIGGLDKGTGVTLQNKFIPYGDFTITLIDTSVTEGDVNNKCTNFRDSIVHIAPYPTAAFTWAKACSIDTTYFTNATTIPNNGVSYFSTYEWDAGGAGNYHYTTSNTSTHPRYKYANPGLYQARLIATTQRIVYINADPIPDDTVTFAGCKDTSIVEVYNLPTIAPTTTNPYKTSFENDDASWAPSGQNYSWSWTNPANKDSIVTTRNVWVTGDSIYNVAEKSYLNSPCFNFTNLNKPMVLLKMWTGTTAQLAGGILQVSTDNGNNWQMIGNIGDGQNWYNSQGVVGLIGTPGNNLAVGWSGQSKDWVDSRIGLSSLAGNPKVRLRVVFSATSDELGRTDGFALDSVWVGNRSKVVLMEHFTNVSAAGSTAANAAIDNIRAARNLDVALIAMHTSFPGSDPYASYNFSDPGARILYYGIATSPRTVMDGTYYNGNIYSGGTSATRIDVADVDARSLETAEFDISMNSEVSAGKISLGVKTKYLQSTAPSKNLVLQVAVVEDSASSNNTMNAVLRKMLPDAAGTHLVNWDPADSTISNFFSWTHNLPGSAKLGVVTYIQDINTREIYQAAYLKGTGTNGSLFVDGTLDAHFSKWELILFPNPATESATVLFGGAANQFLRWELINALGEIVQGGSVSPGAEGFSVDTQNETPGVYTMKITDGYSNVNKKLVIVK